MALIPTASFEKQDDGTYLFYPDGYGRPYVLESKKEARKAFIGSGLIDVLHVLLIVGGLYLSFLLTTYLDIKDGMYHPVSFISVLLITFPIRHIIKKRWLKNFLKNREPVAPSPPLTNEELQLKIANLSFRKIVTSNVVLVTLTLIIAYWGITKFLAENILPAIVAGILTLMMGYLTFYSFRDLALKLKQRKNS